MTIDKFVYVCLNYTPYTGIRTMYDETEDAVDAESLRSNIVRETLKYCNVSREVTISSMSDVRAHGAGLGSSSAFTVGLLAGLKRSMEPSIDYFNPFWLAETASKIEIEKCGYAIGKQDQYAAAWGGANLFVFQKDDTVDVVATDALSEGALKLSRNLLLVYSGKSRKADDILRRQASEAETDNEKMKRIQANADRAYEARVLLENERYDLIGELLHEAWEDKKKIVSGMTNNYFDDIYDRARKAGAVGGKLLGAGGGGFFVFYVKPEKQEEVVRAVTKCSSCLVYPFAYWPWGCETYEIS